MTAEVGMYKGRLTDCEHCASFGGGETHPKNVDILISGDCLHPDHKKKVDPYGTCENWRPNWEDY